VSINTITKLLLEVGRESRRFHNEAVIGLKTKLVQVDEIRSFISAKPKSVPKEIREISGDVCTWTAMDADSKLMISWEIGDRSRHSVKQLISDVRSRIATERIRFCTDGFSIYSDAPEEIYGYDIEAVQNFRSHGSNYDLVYFAQYSASNIWVPNGVSKKVENHRLALALHFVHYNFVKVHKTLRVTPAMEAGIAKKPWTIEELIKLFQGE